MKMQLNGRRFHTVAEIQHESQITTHTWSQKHQYNNSRRWHSDVALHTALSRLKVTIGTGATLCGHLFARYGANPETFWYTLVCLMVRYNHNMWFHCRHLVGKLVRYSEILFIYKNVVLKTYSVLAYIS
jgi:hypothetical protein